MGATVMGVFVNKDIAANTVILTRELIETRLAYSGAGGFTAKAVETVVGGAFVIVATCFTLMFFIGAGGVVAPCSRSGIAIIVGCTI